MATTAPIHKNWTTSMGRISGFLNSGGLYRDLNLPAKFYSETAPLTSITHWAMGGESGEWKKYKFEEIITKPFTAAKVGDSFGPTWATHWFKIEFTVPAAWAGKEVHLRWNSNSEAALYTLDGKMIQGFSSEWRQEYVLSTSWDGSSGPISYYVEMAVTGLFGRGNGDLIAPTNNNTSSSLARADLAVYEKQFYKLHTDIDMLYGIANELSNDHRGYQAMFCANEMINLIDNEDYVKASEIADAFFSEGAGKKTHTLVSMGHCHIDTAWLWPYEETIRKIARSWSAQVQLIKEYPDYVFTCSSALQYQWLKDWYPDVFAQVKDAVALGRFVPVGGAWIELDGNIPSGESFLRQFFYGQRFFKQEFGIVCNEFWLPDTFGYSAQIPQMMKHVGINHFLTIKLARNVVNRFPTHNFWWEGIDGTQVLVHMPPGDNYNMNGTPNQLMVSMNNSRDKGRSNIGGYLFGYGDGGGGPTRQLIDRQQRLKDVDGLPKIVFEKPDYLFEQLSKEGGKLSKWVGELYLEIHNGTYTSQAKIKWSNRKGEFLLKEVELLMAIALQQGKVSAVVFAQDQLLVDASWKNLLLNQFHDVLPGSCIQLAAQRAWEVYDEIFSTLYGLRTKYNGLLLGSGTATKAIFNSLPWDVKTVIFNKPDTGNPPTGTNIQAVDLKTTAFENQNEGQFRAPSTFSAALVNLKASGYTQFAALAPTNPVVYTPGTGSTAQYSNGLVRLEVQKTGIPYEELYFTGPSNTEHKVFGDRLNSGTRGGQFYIYKDVPLYYDAWDINDYHLETRRFPDYTTFTPFENIAGGPIVGISKFTGSFSKSTVEKYTIIRADSPMIEYYTIVDWKEDHRLLKVEFPLDILAREATYEIQYGHINRPTHMNTTWDMAQYEVCGHKWMDISQADKGVTIITDSKYGWHARDNLVTLSLLKSPKNPDGNCDMQKHFIYYAVLPHEGTFQKADVIRRAYELNVHGANNVPLLATSLTGAALPQSWVTTDNPAVIVEAFKVAADNPRAVVVRVYESHGGAASANINLGFPITKVQECNGLEAPSGDVPSSGNSFAAEFTRPFEIKSFLVSF